MRTMIAIMTMTGVLLCSQSVVADIVLTDNCQDDIRALQDDMRENKDDYTAESRTKANAELTVAKTNIINPVKCRKNIHDAREALRKGNRDKKDKD